MLLFFHNSATQILIPTQFLIYSYSGLVRELSINSEKPSISILLENM